MSENMCLLCLYMFIVVFLWLIFSCMLVCFVLFWFVLIAIFLDGLFPNEREKEGCRTAWEEKQGRSEKSWGKGNYSKYTV